MAWFNLNDSLNDLKGQLSNFANIVLPDVTDTEENSAINNGEDVKVATKSTEKIPENESEQNVWSWDSPGTKTDETKTNETISNLKQKIKLLENERAEYIEKLEQLDVEFQENTSKLASDKEKLSVEFNDLEEKYESLKNSTSKLFIKEAKYKEEIDKLRKAKSEENNLSQENEKLQEKISELESLLKNQNKLPDEIEINSRETEKENEVLIQKLKDELSNFKREHDLYVREIHEKYKEIFLGNFKAVTTDNENFTVTEQDSNLLNFNKIVSQYLSNLSEFKLKYDSLEGEFQKISQEKLKIANEKNREIEKLLENSEILSQEVITKSNTVKDLQNECEELMKNNELLILDLESYKNTSLQTISESNEDNMILLEGQLETATKRIEELLAKIADMERRNSIIQEVDDSKEAEYEELLYKFNMLQKECDELRKENTKFVEKTADWKKEKEQYELIVEKIKSDLENTEYQFSELNVHLESLKEEKNAKSEEFNEAKLQKEEVLQKELEIFKKKYDEECKKTSEFQTEIKNYEDKLKNVTTINDTLKTQCDSLNKELSSLSEAKQNFQTHFSKLAEISEDFNVNDKTDVSQVIQKFIEKYTQVNVEIKFLKEQLAAANFIYETELEKNARLSSQLQELQISNQNNFNSQSLQEDVASLEDQKVCIMRSLLEIIGLELGENNSFESVLEVVKSNIQNVLDEYNNLNKSLSDVTKDLKLTQHQLDEVNQSRNELINMLKEKHEENILYHNEIQRLSALLKSETEKNNQATLQDDGKLEKLKEENEKLSDQNQFLREKCEVLASNLLQEQSKVQNILADKSSSVSENETALTKKLERLQSHLLEVEEHYTQELLLSEQKRTELQNKMSILEEKEKQSNTLYTSVNIRANQQVESLQAQLQLITAQRDELRIKLSDMEDQCNKHLTSVTNLQFVLEQFQKDKNNEVHRETDRIRKQIAVEVQKQDELKIEIESLKKQLQDSKEGLYAASRLSSQLEHSKHQAAILKEEVAQLQDKLRKTEEKLSSVSSQTDGKIDKLLIKNLILGFISSNNNLNLTTDQSQILKIIATVLDFNQQDHDKVKSKQQHGSWLSSFLVPQQGQSISQESLSLAFVKFLENESKPRVIPNLLDNADTSNKEQDASAPNSRKPSTSKPIVLSEIVLPTFDFAQNRNSSSILKDVMKEKN